MSYQILAVPKTNQLIIQSSNNAANQLVLADHRDLLQLRARINQYLDTLDADGDAAPPPPPGDEMISTSQARSEAARRGQEFEDATLRFAIVRGTIPGAEKRGGRWYIPRSVFDKWLEGHLSRK